MFLFLFWAVILLIVYTWFGYFFVLYISKTIFTKIDFLQPIHEEYSPPVTTIITVHNEEKKIDDRIKTLLGIDYPIDRHEIIVASDGSTDKTNEIVELEKRVKLFKTAGGGKSFTQNMAIQHANGDIIVLTDADTDFKKDTIKNLVKNFSDNQTGCVSGKLILEKEEGMISESQGLYWKYEMMLRQLESKLGLLHTASGSVMAFRKSLFIPFNSKYGDDCIIPLDILSQGYKVIHEDEAIAYDTFPSTMESELNARIRMTLRNFTCTLSKTQLLNPFRHPLLSLSIVSHKLLRWLTPFFLIILFTVNFLIIGNGDLFKVSFLIQLLFYFLGFIGFVGQRINLKIPVASQIFSFLLANTGFFIGVCKACSGQSITSYKNIRLKGNKNL